MTWRAGSGGSSGIGTACDLLLPDGHDVHRVERRGSRHAAGGPARHRRHRRPPAGAEDFGLFAVTIVIYTVAVSAGEFGVASAVIRTTRALDEMAPTAVTISLVSGVLMAGAMFGVAPLAAREMGAPDATTPIRIMALILLLTGPGAVPGALLTRNFMQDRRFAADLVGFVVGNSILVGMALGGWGVLALAWSRVLGHAATVLVIMWLSPRRHPPVSTRAWRAGWSTSGCRSSGRT